VKKQSAGLLLYRIKENGPEFLLVHPGGPHNAKKDIGAWSVPKGEFSDDEDPLTVAKREFEEETGFSIDGTFTPLQPVKQKGGKTVYAWAIEKDMDMEGFTSNTFMMEWPYNSGKFIEVPEIDRAEWFPLQQAREKINRAQAAFIEELLVTLK
jgi:predicted NUDIX family NTP pyrophosphohydrolase